MIDFHVVALCDWSGFCKEPDQSFDVDFLEQPVVGGAHQDQGNQDQGEIHLVVKRDGLIKLLHFSDLRGCGRSASLLNLLAKL